MKKVIAFKLSSLFALIVLLGIIVTANPVNAKVIRWRMEGIYPSTAMPGKFAPMWAKAITHITDKGLQIQYAEPGAIVPAKEIFMAVSNGTLDCASEYGTFHRAVMPETDIECGLPFAWMKPEEIHDAYYNRGLLEEMRKIYAEHNIYFVAPSYCNIIYGYPLTKPVRKPSDFKGMKIRDLGLAADWVAHYGASPTVLPAGEMYMALKLKTIDGVHFGTASLDDYKLGEVCKYFLIEPHTGAVASNLLINMDAWKKLPKDIKNLINNYSSSIMLQNTINWDENAKWQKYSKKYGVEGIHWSQEDIDSSQAFMIKTLWQKIAAKSDRCKKLVEMINNQAKDLGRIK